MRRETIAGIGAGIVACTALVGTIAYGCIDYLQSHYEIKRWQATIVQTQLLVTYGSVTVADEVLYRNEDGSIHQAKRSTETVEQWSKIRPGDVFDCQYRVLVGGLTGKARMTNGGTCELVTSSAS